MEVCQIRTPDLYIRPDSTSRPDSPWQRSVLSECFSFSCNYFSLNFMFYISEDDIVQDMTKVHEVKTVQHSNDKHHRNSQNTNTVHFVDIKTCCCQPVYTAAATKTINSYNTLTHKLAWHTTWPQNQQFSLLGNTSSCKGGNFTSGEFIFILFSFLEWMSLMRSSRGSIAIVREKCSSYESIWNIFKTIIIC